MKPASDNLNLEVVDCQEVELGQVKGPTEIVEMPIAQISQFGVVPRNHQPGKWRLIVSLSQPQGAERQ